MANFPITINPARVSPLILNERDNGGSSVRYQILFSDIAVSGATGNADTVTMTLGNTPLQWVCSSAYAAISTTFTGTTSLTMQVGTTSSAAAFLAATQLIATTGLIQPSTGVNTTASIANSTGVSSVVIQALFTNATGGSPSALTAGSAWLFLSITDLTAFY